MVPDSRKNPLLRLLFMVAGLVFAMTSFLSQPLSFAPLCSSPPGSVGVRPAPAAFSTKTPTFNLPASVPDEDHQTGCFLYIWLQRTVLCL
jgi:hypothetical protein